MTTDAVTWGAELGREWAGLAAIYPETWPYLVPDSDALADIDERAGDPAFERLPAALAWSLAAFSVIGGLPPAELGLPGLRYRPLRLATGAELVVFRSDLDRAIWNRLPLPSHHRDPDGDDCAAGLTTAFDHLERHYPFIAPVLRDVASNVMVTALLPDWRGSDYRITSASFPVMPGTIFVSRKAFHHIPPSTVAPEPAVRLAAENLLHESIHQAVNLAILTRPVLADDYASADSPRVEIAWRMQQDVIRNRYWEVDRVLHAATVYVAASYFRIVELEERADGRPELAHLRAALGDGCAALDFLSTALLAHHAQLGDDGVPMTRALRRDAEGILARARPLLAEPLVA